MYNLYAELLLAKILKLPPGAPRKSVSISELTTLGLVPFDTALEPDPAEDGCYFLSDDFSFRAGDPLTESDVLILLHSEFFVKHFDLKFSVLQQYYKYMPTFPQTDSPTFHEQFTVFLVDHVSEKRGNKSLTVTETKQMDSTFDQQRAPFYSRKTEPL